MSRKHNTRYLKLASQELASMQCGPVKREMV
jgi:hypothetical protein